MPIEPILALFKPDFVFSLTFIVAFLGFGHFVNKSFFPWFKEYMAMRSVSQDLQQKRFDMMIQVMTDFRSELSAFRETHSIILAYIISDLTENQPEKPSDTAAVRALKKRQSTQDILLRRVEGSDNAGQ